MFHIFRGCNLQVAGCRCSLMIIIVMMMMKLKAIYIKQL